MPVCFLDAHATTMMTPLFLSFSLSHCPFSCLPEFPLIAPYGAVNSVAFDCNIVCVPVSPTPISFSRRCRAFTLTAGEISRMHTARVTSLPPCLAHPPLIITVTSRTCRPVAELGFLGHDIWFSRTCEKQRPCLVCVCVYVCQCLGLAFYAIERRLAETCDGNRAKCVEIEKKKERKM